MRMKAALAATIALASGAAAPRSADHVVRIEIRDGDRLVAQPALRVREGVPAAIRASGKDGYAFRIRIDPAQGKSRDIMLRTSFQLPDGKGGWTQVAAPWMLVAAGSEGKLIVPAQGVPGFRFTLTVN
jgi:hypothetical protein